MAIPLSRDTFSAFIVGVAGNSDPAGYAERREEEDDARIKDLRRRVRAVLEWMSNAKGWLDPVRGEFFPAGNLPADTASQYFKCWHPLFPRPEGGAQHTPIIVLSSLERGADIIVAEEALDFAQENRVALTVRVPLGFPLDIYRTSSSVLGTGSAASDQNALARFDAVVARIRNQRGFIEDRDIFCVALDRDLDGDPAADLTDNARRRLRYRAAGEFIATNSNLLLAVYDRPWDERNWPQPPGDAQIFGPVDIYAPGTAAIVRAKRAGLTHKLLAVSNSFAWADNGPVLLIPMDRKKNVLAAETRKPCARPLEFLHPYDTMEKRGIRDDDAEWQKRGDERFRRIVRCQEDFNALPISPGEDTACAELLRQRGGVPFDGLGPEAARFARTHDILARVRRRAADEAARADSLRDTMLFALAALIAIAAGALGTFEHWHPQNAHATQDGHHAGWFVSVPGAPAEVVLLCVSLLAVALSAFAYRRYRRGENENHRFDLRALAEGLRVQFFWDIAGIPESVPANYMQRQQGELTWIRYAIGALALPFERSQRAFESLAPESRQELLVAAVRCWVGGQRDYFHRAGRRAKDRRHRCHLFGWAFSIAAVTQVIFMFIAKLAPFCAACIDAFSITFAAALIAIGVGLIGRERLRPVAMLGSRGLIEMFHCATGFSAWTVCLLRGGLARIIAMWSDGCLAEFSPPACNAPCEKQPHEHETGCERWLRTCEKRLRDYADHLENGTSHSSEDDEDDPRHRVRNLRELWGVALIFAAPVLCLPHLLGHYPFLPESKDWWIILTGMLLLSGALILGWAERNFLSEISRQYHTMLGLYTAAYRRLDPLIDALPATERGPQCDRIHEEIRIILHALGCEALGENAEWLILRRARPLEPFTAG